MGDGEAEADEDRNRNRNGDEKKEAVQPVYKFSGRRILGDVTNGMQC